VRSFSTRLGDLHVEFTVIGPALPEHRAGIVQLVDTFLDGTITASASEPLTPSQP
jgi:hypothetical protein